MQKSAVSASLTVALLGVASAALALIQGPVDTAPPALAQRAIRLEEPGVVVDEARQQ